MSGVKLSGPFMSRRTGAVSSAGTRWIAFLMRISNLSQSSGSVPKEKSAGMPSMPQGLAQGSKPPMRMPPTSSLK